MNSETRIRRPRAGSRSWPSWFVVLCAVVLSFALAGEAFAQTSTGRGRVRGRVLDTQGDPVANATITMTHVSTGDTVTAETDDEGTWLKGGLGRGQWRIVTSAEGFQDDNFVMQVQQFDRNTVETVMIPGTSGGTGEGPTLSSLFEGELGDRIEAANVVFDSGDYAAALAEYEAIIAEETAKEEPNPEIHLLHLNAGNAASEMGDNEAAIAHYQALLEGSPDNPDARMGLANVYMQERRLEDAIAVLEQMDMSTVTDPIVFYNIGTLFFDQGESAEAQGYYEQAVALDPSFADAYMQLGLSLIQQGKMEEAGPHLQKVIELAPDTENAALAQEFLAMIQG